MIHTILKNTSNIPDQITQYDEAAKKPAKGKSIAQIADECEETEERIQKLMKKL